MFLDLMRKHLKPKEVNDALTNVVKKSPPDFDASDGGKFLTVDTDGSLVWKEYEPPAYSTQEFNTGQKWTDGKDIYSRVISGTFPEISASQTVVIATLATGLNVIFQHCEAKQTSGNITAHPFISFYSPTNGNLNLYNVGTTYSEQTYNFIIKYTKPDPVPTNETKTTKERKVK